MRALLVMAVIVGGALVVSDPADARRAARHAPAYAYGGHVPYAQPRAYRPRSYRPRAYRPRYYGPRSYGYAPQYYGAARYYAPPRYYSRDRAVCEERAWNEDPAGVYAGYPCWARIAFSRGGGRR